MKERKKLIFESIFGFLAVEVLMVILEVTEITFDTEWFRDIDVWINDFFVNTMVFILMATFLSKIKNEHVNFGISYILSIAIGNFVILSTDNFDSSFKSVLFVIICIVIDIVALIAWGWEGYLKGKRKGQKMLAKERDDYIQTISQMDNKTRTELYNARAFIKKHPKECEIIDAFGIDFILEVIEDDKIIRKARKNDPTNKTTN